MIAKSRLSLATLVLASALCLVQCGEVEKLERSLNNERDLFGAIALQKPQATTGTSSGSGTTTGGTTTGGTTTGGTTTTGTTAGTTAGTTTTGTSTTTAASAANVFFAPNHAGTDAKKRCSALPPENDPLRPDRCDSGSVAATAARAQCSSTTSCEVVLEFKGTTESPACASIAYYAASISDSTEQGIYGVSSNASSQEADRGALQACEVKLAPERDRLWCKKELIGVADCANRLALKRFSAGAVDPIPQEVKCVVAGSACLR